MARENQSVSQLRRQSIPFIMHLEKKMGTLCVLRRERKYLSSGVYDVRTDLSGRPDGISDVCILFLPSDTETHGTDRENGR